MAQEAEVARPGIEECREEIEAARRELALALARLRERNLNPLDYRGWVERHPIPVTLGAIAAGFILAAPGGSGDGTGRPSLLSELSRSGMLTLLPIAIRALAPEE
jgi:hypothetical protein